MTLPTIIPWRELRPGDLAWDAGNGDLVTSRFWPLLQVGDDNVARWLAPSGVEVELRPLTWSEPLGPTGAFCPWAVLLSRDTKRDPDVVLVAVEAVAEAARALVAAAGQDPVAQAEERLFWPFTAELPALIGDDEVVKVYRWRIEPGAEGPRVVAEHKLVGAPIDRWSDVRNPDTLARLRGLI